MGKKNKVGGATVVSNNPIQAKPSITVNNGVPPKKPVPPPIC